MLVGISSAEIADVNASSTRPMCRRKKAAPTSLCSINLEAKQGSVTRKLSEEVSVVELGLTETAQYAGSTLGSKAELLEDIANPSNWIRDASRQLSGFSIATANGTATETTSMQPGNGTTSISMTESTTMSVTETVTVAMTGTSTDTTVPEDEGHPDAACHSGLAFGVLMALVGRSIM